MSSLISLDKKLLNEKFKEFGVDDILWNFHTEKQIEKMEFRFGKVKVFNKNDYSKYEGNGYEVKLLRAKLPKNTNNY